MVEALTQEKVRTPESGDTEKLEDISFERFLELIKTPQGVSRIEAATRAQQNVLVSIGEGFPKVFGKVTDTRLRTFEKKGLVGGVGDYIQSRDLLRSAIVENGELAHASGEAQKYVYDQFKKFVASSNALAARMDERGREGKEKITADVPKTEPAKIEKAPAAPAPTPERAAEPARAKQDEISPEPPKPVEPPKAPQPTSTSAAKPEIKLRTDMTEAERKANPLSKIEKKIDWNGKEVTVKSLDKAPSVGHAEIREKRGEVAKLRADYEAKKKAFYEDLTKKNGNMWGVSWQKLKALNARRYAEFFGIRPPGYSPELQKARDAWQSANAAYESSLNKALTERAARANTGKKEDYLAGSARRFVIRPLTAEVAEQKQFLDTRRSGIYGTMMEKLGGGMKAGFEKFNALPLGRRVALGATVAGIAVVAAPVFTAAAVGGAAARYGVAKGVESWWSRTKTKQREKELVSAESRASLEGVTLTERQKQYADALSAKSFDEREKKAYAKGVARVAGLGIAGSGAAHEIASYVHDTATDSVTTLTGDGGASKIPDQVPSDPYINNPNFESGKEDGAFDRTSGDKIQGQVLPEPHINNPNLETGIDDAQSTLAESKIQNQILPEPHINNPNFEATELGKNDVLPSAESAKITDQVPESETSGTEDLEVSSTLYTVKPNDNFWDVLEKQKDILDLIPKEKHDLVLDKVLDELASDHELREAIGWSRADENINLINKGEVYDLAPLRELMKEYGAEYSNGAIKLDTPPSFEQPEAVLVEKAPVTTVESAGLKVLPEEPPVPSSDLVVPPPKMMDLPSTPVVEVRPLSASMASLSSEIASPAPEPIEVEAPAPISSENVPKPRTEFMSPLTVASEATAETATYASPWTAATSNEALNIEPVKAGVGGSSISPEVIEARDAVAAGAVGMAPQEVSEARKEASARDITRERNFLIAKIDGVEPSFLSRFIGGGNNTFDTIKGLTLKQIDTLNRAPDNASRSLALRTLGIDQNKFDAGDFKRWADNTARMFPNIVAPKNDSMKLDDYLTEVAKARIEKGLAGKI